MTMRSTPPASSHFAEIPVPAPAPMIGRPASALARRRSRMMDRAIPIGVSHVRVRRYRCYFMRFRGSPFAFAMDVLREDNCRRRARDHEYAVVFPKFLSSLG